MRTDVLAADLTDIRGADGTALPASNLTPTVTDSAITFGDITGLTGKATARFDAGDGGAGNDVLIGGAGSDALLRQDGDDLLVAGTTAFDDNLAALDAVLAEWTSGRTYAQRVANLRGTGSGPRANGNTFLKVSGPGVTAFDDGAVDALDGASGSDWFFAHLSGGVTDVIFGRGVGEVVDELEVRAR